MERKDRKNKHEEGKEHKGERKAFARKNSQRKAKLVFKNIRSGQDINDVEGLDDLEDDVI